MKKVLIIGGTRNIGYFLTRDLLEKGYDVTLFNRGLTPDSLPEGIRRLQGDRTDRHQLTQALRADSFDVIVDLVLYDADNAETIVERLSDNVEQYIFISTGQVYLVREGLERPFSEDDYEGRLMPAPKPNTFGYEEWNYGMQKRRAEDVLAGAAREFGLPYTSLRLPMVNSQRDPFNRLYGYILRLRDGGPILVPQTPQHPLRHVYVLDVVRAIETLIRQGPGPSHVYNISQDETLPLPDFLSIVAELLDTAPPRVIEVKRSLLEAQGFLPDCSPFSDRWMSELTNERSKAELDMVYTPIREALAAIIAHYQEEPPRKPASYSRRSAERNLILQL